MRLFAFAVLALLAAGCASAPTDTVVSTSSTSSAATSNPPAIVLGQMYLHADGQRTWMDSKPGTGDVDSPMASVATQSAKLVFPLEPVPSFVVATSGTARIHVATASPGTVGSVTIQVTFLLNGQRIATSTASGTDTVHSLTIPATFPAGEPIAIEVCLCNATAQTFVMDTSGGSTAEVPGPAPPPPSGKALPAGPVTTRQEGDAWIAERTDASALTVPAGKAKVVMTSVNGDVAQGTGTPRFEGHLWGRGATDQQARDWLATLYVEFTVTTSSGLDLAAHLKTTSTASDAWSHLGGDFDLGLPTDLVVSGASLETTNGDVASHGLAIDDLSTTTTNGDLDATGTLSTWTARTTNGGITGDVGAPTAGGDFSLDTTNGDVDLILAQTSDNGVDVTGRTTNGDVTLTFANSEDVGSQSATSGHVRTTGYDGKATHTGINMSSTNGGVSATDGP